MTTPTALLPLERYDRVVVAFSGGKDSLASLLHLLELGVPRTRIELWHHQIDAPGEPFMDWPSTPAYCRGVAHALGVPLLFSGREGGFLRELSRREQPTGRVWFQQPDGTVGYAGGKGPPGTRGRFPQPGADLKTRWCSAYLKIDVGRRVLANDPRFARGRFLYVTGERSEESAQRARYHAVELDEASRAQRQITRWRPVHAWPETAVWQIIERWRVRPHPAYRLGWGRLSCMSCIFGDASQWASVRQIAPSMFQRIAQIEQTSGSTIHRKLSVVQQADAAAAFFPPGTAALQAAAMREDYAEPALLRPHERWTLPAGAFKRTSGPS
jgi:3'-phosphoadenosine 5'-phosphosulfate sulfotransferase (PAPS reductase)/FAD synthetase